MADLTTANLIQAVTPVRYATGVLTNQPITVKFFRDILQSTLTSSTVTLEVVGTPGLVATTIAYANRVLTITPTGGLQPNTTYKLSLVGDVNPATDIATMHIAGIQDITGNGMIGIFETTFTTGAVGVPAAPVIVSPTPSSSILTQPTFVWNAVTGAAKYELQVATDNTFGTLYWPSQTSDWTGTQTSITPQTPFDFGKEYWWRVRAISYDAQSNPIPGSWSPPYSFYFGDPTLGVVTPDDAPLGQIPPTKGPVQIVDASPAPGAANIQPSDYPTQITVKLMGSIDLGAITPDRFRIKAEAIDGSNFDVNQFTPIFSPTLNGSQFGTGGITAEMAVDQYQRIMVSDKQNLEIQGSTDAQGYTVLTATVSSDYWHPNNKYTLTLDLQEMASPVEWTFTTCYSPCFAGVAQVRAETDHFMPEASDDEILFHIRDNSLEALRIQVYVPTQINGERWIYNPPVSFNVLNPPYFVRKYVQIATTLDLLKHKQQELLGAGRVQLGDFQVDKQLMALRDNIKVAIAGLEEELRPYKDELHGHMNRGYARGEWAERGERTHLNQNWGYPFGGRSRGTRF